MTLNFPNQSRNYDQTRHCVRFWTYDDALEIPFFVEEEALYGIDPTAIRDESAFLSAFDFLRDRICEAAVKVYSRHGRGSYTLTAQDIR